MSSDAMILVVDDDAVACDLLVEVLQKEGYKVDAVTSGKEAIAKGQTRHYDVVLTDMRMGEVDGLAVLRAFRERSPDTAIVLLTAFGSMEGAIEAIRQGAYDYLAKPFKKEEIKLVVRRSLEHSRLLRENALYKDKLRDRQEYSLLVGSSTAMLDVYKLVAKVSQGRSTVLLEGESGTGKELIARAIHTNSPRREQPFVPVNFAALSESVMESELFGHEKGAFTGALVTKGGLFEEADRGTIFLDEIGDLKPSLQVKLLRVIQEQEVRRVGGTTSRRVDVRIIAATNRDLARQVKEGRFREDLYYRLNVVRIVLPPLRDRREDIPMLANHFLRKFSVSNQVAASFVPETMSLLQGYPWPGNVRELENVVERAISLAHGPLIMPSDLPESLRTATILSLDERGTRRDSQDSAMLTLDEVDKRHLVRVLRETGGNKVKAAKIMGIDRRTLYRMAERFGIDLGDEPGEAPPAGG